MSRFERRNFAGQVVNKNFKINVTGSSATRSANWFAGTTEMLRRQVTPDEG